MNTVTNGLEIPDNDQMLFVRREEVIHNDLPYEIVVKSSKEALIKLPRQSMRFFTSVQILDPGKNEIFHTFFPNIFSKEKADSMILKIKEDIENYING